MTDLLSYSEFQEAVREGGFNNVVIRAGSGVDDSHAVRLAALLQRAVGGERRVVSAERANAAHDLLVLLTTSLKGAGRVTLVEGRTMTWAVDATRILQEVCDPFVPGDSNWWQED